MTPDPHAATDKRVLDTLKDVHNRGADLYNAGEVAAALRFYQGALLVARAFLDHRPSIRRVIDDGLHEVARAGGNVKLSAFRLHEVIEQVRADLKAVWRTAKAPVLVTGAVTAGGAAVPQARVAFHTARGELAAAAVAGADGTFTLAVPPGEYAVTVTGPGVPAGPPRAVEVKADADPLRLDL
jgi:hypothetical protein